jgi:hypothetical protein
LVIATYLRTLPSLIGLITAGKEGLRYGSLFDTYMLVLNNSELKSALSVVFRGVSLREGQMGGSVVVTCLR